MKNTQVFVVGLIAVVGLVLGGLAFFKTPQPPIGSVSGPDLFSPYFSVDGVVTEYRRSELRTPTTTPCALRAPTSATSTLKSATLRITTSTTTATIWTAAKATTAFATSTIIATSTVASGAVATLHAATTTFEAALSQSIELQKLTDRTFAPGEYLVWGYQGVDNVTGTTKLNGVCQAIFEVI